MSKCDNCELRKEMARVFDFHWLGKDDCPYSGHCEEEQTNSINLYVILYRMLMVMYSIFRICVHGDTLNEHTSIMVELNDIQSEIRKGFDDNNKI